MQEKRLTSIRFRSGKKADIWLALSIVLGLHTLILFIPIANQKPHIQDLRPPIELQLTIFKPPATDRLETLNEPESQLPEPVPELAAETPQNVVETPLENKPAMITPVSQTTGFVARQLRPELDTMNQQEKRHLTNTILARQFGSEQSAADQLFGRTPVQQGSELQSEFHFPHRQDMITLLDQPMPEVPFAYTPGLINFAYEPGVKGDLQRFWDVITPEFGWRTKYGTEVRCIWVLVIVGCGWK